MADTNGESPQMRAANGEELGDKDAVGDWDLEETQSGVAQSTKVNQEKKKVKQKVFVRKELELEDIPEFTEFAQNFRGGVSAEELTERGASPNNRLYGKSESPNPFIKANAKLSPRHPKTPRSSNGKTQFDFELKTIELQARNRNPKLSPSQKSAESLHIDMISRSATKQWERGAGQQANLSYLKLKAVINLKHPRMVIDGKNQRIPLCIPTGRLLNSFEQKLQGFDELGMAVSIYFKLLKSFITMFSIFSVLCIPLYYIYSCGDMSRQATGSLQARLSEWTLGNLGESSNVCKSNNLRLYDTMTLWCPSGTRIKKLKQFGLQKVDAKPEDNSCPQTIDKTQADGILELLLDEQCSLAGLQKEFPDYFKTLEAQFKKLCLNQETCDMYVRNIDWPEPCREKIGIRLQVVNVPIIRYISNIQNVTTVEDDVTPIGWIDEDLLPPAILEVLDGFKDGDFGTNTSSLDPSSDGSKRMLADNLAAQTATTTKSHSGITSNPNITTTNTTAVEQIQACNDTIEAEQDANGTSNKPRANSTCSNITVSTYIEYKQAFEYVISDKSTSFYLYAVVECLNDDVEL